MSAGLNRRTVSTTGAVMTCSVSATKTPKSAISKITTKNSPYADGDTGGSTAFFNFCADQITHGQKGCAKNHAGSNQKGEWLPCGNIKTAVGKLKGNTCQSVACRGSKGKDDEVADKFTGKDFGCARWGNLAATPLYRARFRRSVHHKRATSQSAESGK